MAGLPRRGGESRCHVSAPLNEISVKYVFQHYYSSFVLIFDFRPCKLLCLPEKSLTPPNRG